MRGENADESQKARAVFVAAFRLRRFVEQQSAGMTCDNEVRHGDNVGSTRGGASGWTMRSARAHRAQRVNEV